MQIQHFITVHTHLKTLFFLLLQKQFNFFLTTIVHDIFHHVVKYWQVHLVVFQPIFQPTPE